MPNRKTKALPVLFDGKITAQVAVIDFSGLKKADQASIWEVIRQATQIRFKKVEERGRQIILEFTWTNRNTVMSFLREVVTVFGYEPKMVS